MTRAQRRQMVDCPWLRDAPPRGPSVREQGEAMASAICSPFGSVDGCTFPCLSFPPPPAQTPPTPSMGDDTDRCGMQAVALAKALPHRYQRPSAPSRQTPAALGPDATVSGDRGAGETDRGPLRGGSEPAFDRMVSGTRGAVKRPLYSHPQEIGRAPYFFSLGALGIPFENGVHNSHAPDEVVLLMPLISWLG